MTKYFCLFLLFSDWLLAHSHSVGLHPLERTENESVRKLFGHRCIQVDSPQNSLADCNRLEIGSPNLGRSIMRENFDLDKIFVRFEFALYFGNIGL